MRWKELDEHLLQMYVCLLLMSCYIDLFVFKEDGYIVTHADDTHSMLTSKQRTPQTMSGFAIWLPIIRCDCRNRNTHCDICSNSNRFDFCDMIVLSNNLYKYVVYWIVVWNSNGLYFYWIFSCFVYFQNWITISLNICSFVLNSIH